MALPFSTPENERSFSGLIDKALLATGKYNAIVDAVSYANMTIRECQALGLFARDLREDVISPTGDAYIWTRPANLRRIRAVKYVTSGEYPKLKLPGRAQKNEQYFYYASDNYYVFNGVSNSEQIATAIYYWNKPLGYYGKLGTNTSIFPGGPYDTRLAYFDTLEEEWQYLNTAGDGYVDTTGDDDLDEAYRNASSNWLVEDWWDMLMSGVKAKIWNKAGDVRSTTEYSLYKQMQTLLRNTVGYESENF